MFVKLVAIFTLLLFSSGSACRCRYNPNLRRTYFSSDVVNFVKATVTAKEFDEATMSNKYTLSVKENYKGCDPGSSVTVYSGTHSCGVILEVSDTSIVLPITSGSKPSLNLCQFIRPFDDLSTDEKTFLERRSVCCKDICTCVDPDSQVACLIDPCEVTDPPCDEATKCVPNFCGGCFTDWFTNSGTPACL